MKIAWIDDDTEVIDPVIGLLVKDNHEIIRIRTVREALDSVAVLQACDAILLDMILPPGPGNEDLGEYAGLELLRKLRQEYQVEVPVVILSVVDARKIEDQLEPLRVADYLRKPALRMEVKQAVEAASRH